MSYLNIVRYLIAVLVLNFYFPVYATTATATDSGSTAPLKESNLSTTQVAPLAKKQNLNTKSVTSDSSALSLLEKMSQAIAKDNYELVFINGSNIGFETMLYRHGVSNNESVAQLIYMEGPKRIIMQKGDSVSYFEENTQSYSLPAKHIVDSLPTVFYTNFQTLQSYYDFSIVGYGRAANKNAVLVRMLDKQHDRYSQLIWIDQQSYLPLRIDYIDSNGQIIEQFKVAQEKLLTTLPAKLQDIDNKTFPPLLPTIKQTSEVQPTWRVSWLPNGFTLKACNSENSLATGVQHKIESCYFSDGVYSFTLNISPNPQPDTTIQNLIKGMRLIHIETEDGHQVVFIGNLPINTAEKIIEGLSFNH